jgi:glycosyltransferase involved in cell wall biosynthesis
LLGPVVHLTWHLDVGGGELFLRDLAQELRRRNVAQHICTIGPRGPLADEIEAIGVPVTAFGKTSKLGAVVVARLAHHLRRLGPSIVHTHGEAGIFWGLPAARLAGLPAISLVYQNYRETTAKMEAMRWLLRWPESVVVGTKDIGRFMCEDLGVPATRIRTIPCGIVPDSFQRLDRTAAVGTPTIVTVGRLVERKGHRVLIDALRIVRTRYPRAQLIIVGDGPGRSALDAAVAAADLNGAVAFAGTVYPTHRVLAVADLFVFPSIIEPQGLALLEAYAAGVPVVASRCGGIPDMLEDEVDGLLARPDDATDLAAVILRMLDDASLAAACVAHARRRLGPYSVSAIADQWVDLYHQTAESGRH